MVTGAEEIQEVNFYIGLHQTRLCRHFDRCFVSVNILRDRRSDFLVNDWIMDSGAFTEISKYGGYRSDISDYAKQINRWATCGNLLIAVTQDYMCEPFILEKTGLSITEHQRLTIERYDALIKQTTVPVMPVLQGYMPSDYETHLEMYGNRLTHGQWVGVGSVCKRNTDTAQIANILQGIKGKRSDLRLHGFGLKTTALSDNYIVSLLYSADSMAWSFAARRAGKDANGVAEAQSFEKAIEIKRGTKSHQMQFREWLRR